ncbi:MAG: low affinity iron permease family protein [Actinomycetota bacterium]
MKTPQTAILMPSDVSGRIGFFDRFAGLTARAVSRAWFFAFCILLIVVWAPGFLLLKFDTWQLIINTATTIITFLMVALLQNSQVRNDQATQHKLNALADGLSDLMELCAREFEDDTMNQEIRELKLAVGLESEETTTERRDARKESVRKRDGRKGETRKARGPRTGKRAQRA